MSSKALLVALLFLVSACGVKNAPVNPKGSSVPSIEDEHPELNLKKNSIYKSRQ